MIFTSILECSRIVKVKLKLLKKSFHHKGSIVERRNFGSFYCKRLLIKNNSWNCFILTTILFYIILRVLFLLVLLGTFQNLLQRRYPRTSMAYLCWRLRFFLLWAFWRTIFSINTIHSLYLHMVCTVPHIV